MNMNNNFQFFSILGIRVA